MASIGTITAIDGWVGSIQERGAFGHRLSRITTDHTAARATLEAQAAVIWNMPSPWTLYALVTPEGATHWVRVASVRVHWIRTAVNDAHMRVDWELVKR